MLQCLSKISSTFSFNPVISKGEFCKCLWRDRVLMSDTNRRVTIRLLCCAVMLEQDVEHLQLQSSSYKG